MMDRERGPQNFDELVEACEKVEALPQSQAFEQVMYDNHSTRISRFMADKPITFHPRLMLSQFPENLKECFISSARLRIDMFRVVQLLERNEDNSGRRSKMVFEVDGNKYTFFSDDVTSELTIETLNGTFSRTYAPADYTAFLASILFAMQYDPEKPDASFHLTDEPLLLRQNHRDLDEGLIERIIMSMGHHQGQSETITTSLFSTHRGLLEADLTVRETPRVSGVRNHMNLSRITGVYGENTLLQQNEVMKPSKLLHHFARVQEHDLERGTYNERIIDPKEDFGTWGRLCADFYAHVAPLIERYELDEETY